MANGPPGGIIFGAQAAFGRHADAGRGAIRRGALPEGQVALRQ